MIDPWAKDCQTVIKELESGLGGLDQEEVTKRQKEFGPNALPQEEKTEKIKIFLEQFRSPLIYLLVIAGIITLFLKDYTDAGIIFAAVVVNTLFGFFQENKASEALLALKKILKNKATVLRNAIKKEIFQEELVPGDIILLTAGDKVPADARILEAKNLRVNEASLTGEAMAVEKTAETLSLDTVLADRDNMVHMGTVVESGVTKAVVTSTGTKTAFGNIAKLVAETKEEKTPYQIKLINFGKVIGITILIIAALVFAIGLRTNNNFIEMFTISVALAVAAIPEGLPVAMTVVLALGMQRILARKGLVRRLAAAESLGSTTVICIDKTGTLTEGKMAVSRILVGREQLIEFKENVAIDANLSGHTLALEIASLCSEAFIENPEDENKQWKIVGRATDRALVSAALDAGINPSEIEKELPILDREEFNSSQKYSAVLTRGKNNNLIYLMGAPDRILSEVKFIENNGQEESVTEKEINQIEHNYKHLASQGLRLIAVVLKKTQNEKLKTLSEIKDLTLVGLIALKDPLREDVKESLAIAERAGLRPVIVTGDHYLTAKSVAEELGFKIYDDNIMDGITLQKLSRDDLKNVVANIKIFARVEPEQKLKIIEAWQDQNEVVAMTGDGVNDAPALKRADIGLAPGSGTQVAQEVADIVLLDNNFSVIVAAIEEGRVIIDNIRKIITYLLSDAFTEIILIATSLILGWPLAVLAGQILWVNLVEGSLPSIALAFEKKDKSVMRQKPYAKNIPLLSRDMKILIFIIGLITNILILSLFYYLIKYSNYNIEHTRTVIFAALAIGSLFYVFSCKSLRRNIWQTGFFDNVFLISSWFIGILALVLAIYWLPLQLVLKTTALNLIDWVILLILGILNIGLIEIAKWIIITRRANT